MNGSVRRRIVRRLDFFLAALLITSGLAVVLFWGQYATSDEDDETPAASILTGTFMPSRTPIPSLTRTAAPSNTNTPSATSTVTFTATSTATPTHTLTPWPTPLVEPLDLSGVYVGQDIVLNGMAQSGDTIQVYDQGELIATTTAGEDGGWTAEIPAGLDEGYHALVVVAVAIDGTTSSSVPVGFQLPDPPTATFTASPTLTVSPAPTLSPTPTATSSPMPTFTPSPPPTNTASSTPSPTWTPSASPTLTPVPPTATLTRTSTQTPLPVLFVATATATETPVPSATPTNTVTSTITPSATWTASPVPPTATATATETPVPSATPTNTVTSTITPSATWTASPAPPTAIPTPIPPPENNSPSIDAPVSGGVYSPGAIAVTGSALPDAVVQLQAAESGEVLATVPTSADGEWQIVIELQGTEPITLLAVVTDPDGLVLTSEPVTLILAPPVHPNTGMDRVVDSDQTGRAFTALLALLLVAGGFSTFFAGRLIYLLAKDRLKPR